MWTFRGEDPKAEARLFRPGLKDGKLSAIPRAPRSLIPGFLVRAPASAPRPAHSPGSPWPGGWAPLSP